MVTQGEDDSIWVSLGNAPLSVDPNNPIDSVSLQVDTDNCHSSNPEERTPAAVALVNDVAPRPAATVTTTQLPSRSECRAVCCAVLPNPSMASIASTSAPDPPLACPEVPGTACRDTPISLALKGKLTKEKTEEFHRAVEKSNIVFELSGVSKVAITSDGWISISQDHYLTVTAHYIIEGKMRQKVLRTKAIYTAQTGQVVAEEIGEILQEFGIINKIAAVTLIMQRTWMWP
ncbi:hypothetical protein F7725_011702 [Dissostichus mawsoni]|uniref:Uncharacterized protein n=1 Tax=Dissostichus mawsoni TaxID=36200 RepID=A0A7J5ZBF0_DISMA|nr:hypothetical protein F7725_011702 [Dissostichus mawsoni]